MHDAQALIEQLGLIMRSLILEDPAFKPVGRDATAVNARRDAWVRNLHQWLTMTLDELVA